MKVGSRRLFLNSVVAILDSVLFLVCDCFFTEVELSGGVAGGICGKLSTFEYSVSTP